MEIDIETLPEMETGSTGPNQPLTNEDIQRRTNVAMKELDSASGRIQELQDYCRHEEVQIQLIDGTARLVCRFCTNVAGFPSKEQMKKAGYL